ncbi:MAG: ABC transporter ATP-binding protein [Microgenomates group bacterium]
MAKLLIEFQSVFKSFPVKEGEVEVLKNINLKIFEGEFVIIFGPSGCGKSTLLHILLGLEPPTKGQVVFDGVDFYQKSEDERALFRRHKVGMIYQQSLWVSALTVNENVGFPLHLLGWSEDEIDKKVGDVLDLVEMRFRKDFYPTELSSGQQQKISLARALIADPLLIVADEPTGNLDTISGHQLLETFLKLQQKGKTIVMVTHDLEYLKYATKIFHMIDGQIVEEYYPKKRSTINGGKKTINGLTDINVRDKDLLKKLNL